jgi:Uma2 family endonuclease
MTQTIDKSIDQKKYQALGVLEYWIIDDKSQIPAKYCLRGKGKKAIILTLENGEYQRSGYLEGEAIPCKTFPDLSLSVDQVLTADAGEVI